MDEIGRIDGGSIAIRSDAGEDGTGRTVYGYAYRWGELTPVGGAQEYPGLAEGFERGAFRDAIAARGNRPWPHLATHFGTTVAGIRFEEDDIGLRYEGQLLNTTAAREYAESIPAGNDGVSLEFVRRGLESRRQGRTVIHTRVPLIAALAGTYAGAYQGASVALRSDGGLQVEQEIPATVATTEAPTTVVAGPLPLSRDAVFAIAQDAATEMMREYAERGGTP